MCATWFDINKCDDSTCDTTASGYQTRCNLNSEAQTIAYMTSSGTICEEGYTFPGAPNAGAPYGLHSSTYLPVWSLCSWCCNWCDTTATSK